MLPVPSNRSVSSSSAGNKYETARTDKRQKHVNMFMERYKQKRLQGVIGNRGLHSSPSSAPDFEKMILNKESIGLLAEHIYKDYKESPCGGTGHSEAHKGEETWPNGVRDVYDCVYDPGAEEAALLRDIEEYLEQEYAEYLDQSLHLYLDSCGPAPGSLPEGVSEAANGSENMMMDSCSLSDGSHVRVGIQSRGLVDAEELGWYLEEAEANAGLGHDEGLLCPCCQRQVMSIEDEVLFCFNCSASIPLSGRIELVSCGMGSVASSSSIGSSVASAQLPGSFSWGSSAPTGGYEIAGVMDIIKLQLQNVYSVHDQVCKAHSRSVSGMSPQSHLPVSAASLKFSPQGRSCVLGKCEICGLEVLLR